MDPCLTRLVGGCQDITDQKLAEERVRQVNADLEARVAERTRTLASSIRDLEAFNVTISHDLRAPLSVIALSCSVLLQEGGGALPARLIDHLERVKRSATYMTALG